MVKDRSSPVRGHAHLSPCQGYRYALWRRWQPGGPLLLVIGLNPSRADGQQDDPTVRRCIGYARDWGFHGLVLANLFAFRTVSPHILKQQSQPCGPDNDAWLRALHQRCDLSLAAWGNHGAWQHRSSWLRANLAPLYCLGMTAVGEPLHPLYQRKGLKPQPLDNFTL
ncbi:DUF1643 domain-containing protein [Ferrimonas marina]|uniref:DUF1643 domain-containing protein n=1 Tax=Ferrimonas marina TaxID=299255 RepID=A0A1M5MYN3_9GAMM|nr:DUF1643 domain-containing protein [Ferrimonas marina]SHG82327.1 hypothetical protein SAMN02745129_0831 [Ferrimonas marina]